MTKVRKSSRWVRVPQFPTARYEVDIPFARIEQSLSTFAEGCTLTLDPDYQRAHVWTMGQRTAYIEYVLAGGEVGRNITWNAPRWPSTRPGDRLELVDGKQRLETVRMFVRGDVEAYGMRFDSERDRLHLMEHRFRFRVCCLPTRAEVLRLYLNINAGGTPHTAEEIERVRGLLAVEVNNGDPS